MSELTDEELANIVNESYQPEQSPVIYIPKKNLILDSQMLSAVMSCGRYYDQVFNHHFVSVEGKSSSLEMGSIVHTFLEFYYKAIIKGITRNEALGFGLVAAQEYIDGQDKNNLPNIRNTSESECKWALETCQQYTERYKNDIWTPLEVECVKAKVLYEDEELRVLYKVKFDLITDTNDGIFSVDHKSMKVRRDSTTLDNQFMGQCAMLNTRMMYVNKVGFQTSLKPEDKFTRQPLYFSDDRIAEWQGTILPYWCKILVMYADSGYWPPNWRHCENKFGFCQFKEPCEADRHMRVEILGRDYIVGEPWDVGNE